jgi:hypothetical protein
VRPDGLTSSAVDQPQLDDQPVCRLTRPTSFSTGLLAASSGSHLLDAFVVDLEHPMGGIVGILMLPNAKDSPPKFAQTPVGILVSFHVLANLTPPPFHVGLGPSAVGRAPVPKTSVDEDRKPCARKDDVHRATGPRDQSSLYTEPKPPTMQCGAN